MGFISNDRTLPQAVRKGAPHRHIRRRSPSSSSRHPKGPSKAQRSSTGPKRLLSAASPHTDRRVLRSQRSDPDANGRMELRGWSPERQEEQKKRRAEAEVLVRAKEEHQAVEKIDLAALVAKNFRQKEVLSLLSDSESPDHGTCPGPKLEHGLEQTPTEAPCKAVSTLGQELTTTSDSLSHEVFSLESLSSKLFEEPSSARAEENNAKVELQDSPARVIEHEEILDAMEEEDLLAVQPRDPTSPAGEQTAVLDQVSSVRELLSARLFADEALSVGAAKEEASEVDIDDMCLSEVEETLEEKADSTSAAAAAKPWRGAEGPVAILLEELSANAAHFDAGDYWVNGAWDLEALREDVEQQREDRCAHDASLWCREPCADTAAPSSTRQDVDEIKPREAVHERSPSPEYPVFASARCQTLIALPCGSIESQQTGRFAKMSSSPDSDMCLRRKLQQMLGA